MPSRGGQTAGDGVSPAVTTRCLPQNRRFGRHTQAFRHRTPFFPERPYASLSAQVLNLPRTSPKAFRSWGTVGRSRFHSVGFDCFSSTQPQSRLSVRLEYADLVGVALEGWKGGIIGASPPTSYSPYDFGSPPGSRCSGRAPLIYAPPPISATVPKRAF